jgi:DNA-cytosine methyltransferase
MNMMDKTSFELFCACLPKESLLKLRKRMMDKTSFELFCGGGGAAEGIRQAGYTSLGAIDYHQPAVDIYNLNHPVKATCQDILDLKDIPHVDLLWMSPSCKSFSHANVGGQESDNDLKIANKLCDLIGYSRPRNIAIENVPQYQNSNSLDLILTKCKAIGYRCYSSIELASDYGAPTSRKRLIIRLTSNSQLPFIKRSDRPNTNWFKTIEHLVDNLTYSELTDVQKNVMTLMRSNHPVVIERCGYYKSPKVYPSTSSFPTIRAHPHHDQKNKFRVALNLVLPNGKVKVITYQALALIQGFPADYRWGVDRVEACKAIGNSVSPPLSKAVAESFLTNA